MKKNIKGMLCVGILSLSLAAALPAEASENNGWYQQNGQLFYKKNGQNFRGLVKIGNYRYYFNSKGVLQKNRLVLNKYYAGPKGRLITGWQEIRGKRYYFSRANYRAVTGWARIGKKVYYFNADGSLKKLSGVVTTKDKVQYYYDPDTGDMKTGWIHHGTHDYYFSPRNGRAVKGWQIIDGKRYYFNGYGMLVRKRWINKTWYVNENGERASGWQEINGKQFYFDAATGRRTTGWKRIDGKWYFFNRLGIQVKGRWEGSRYLSEDGTLAVNTWIGAYYVGKDGYRTGKTRTAGFFQEGNASYYLNDQFEKLFGWQTINGKTYHFDETTGAMDKEKWVEAFYLEKDGRRAENKCLTLDGATYLFLEDGTKAKGIAEYKGEKYYFSSVTGAMQTGFITVDEITYYFDPDQNGAMAVNTKVKIGEILYTFDENGKLSAQTDVNEDPGEDNSRLGHEIAEYALQFVGYPYVNGGAEDPAKGVDCSGFIVYVMKHFGISVPRMASEQINGVKGYKQPMEVSMDELKPGDLVGCYAGISHIGIYIGDGKMVHASNSRPYPSGGIKISDIQYYSPQRFVRYWY